MRKMLRLFFICFTFCTVSGILISQFTGKATPSDTAIAQKASSAGADGSPLRETSATASSNYQPLKNTVIILDPGHGGNDPGMVWGDILEKDVNLQISRKVKKFLETWGCTVLTTREDDTYVALEDRVQMAGQYTSEHQKADLFISLHLNSVDNDNESSGIETYYNNAANKNSQLLAEAIQAGLINETGAKDRGARGDSNLYVVRKNTIPSCLVEAGFLTSDTERPLLLSDEYQQKIAEGIAEGILVAIQALPDM